MAFQQARNKRIDWNIILVYISIADIIIMLMTFFRHTMLIVLSMRKEHLIVSLACCKLRIRRKENIPMILGVRDFLHANNKGVAG